MADQLRIVLDTNVYISAALHGGLAETAMDLASVGKATISVSQAIVEPQVTLYVVTEDTDDNRILECAVAGEALLIVTFDHDLLRLRRYEGIGIVSPRELLYYGLSE